MLVLRLNGALEWALKAGGKLMAGWFHVKVAAFADSAWTPRQGQGCSGFENPSPGGGATKNASDEGGGPYGPCARL